MVLLGRCCFSNPQMEEQFQRHYALARAQIDAIPAAGAVLAYVLQVLKPYLSAACCYLAMCADVGFCNSLLRPAVPHHSTTQLFRSFLAMAPFISDVLFFDTRYMVSGRATATVITRFLFIFTMVPTSLRSTVFWKYRMLFQHFAMAILKTPLDMYWFGGILTWMGALVMDRAVLSEQCSQSLTCLFGSVQQLVASLLAAAAMNPKAAVVDLVRTLCSQESLAHLSGLLPPYLLMLHLEQRARKAWLAATQQAPAARSVNLSAHPALQQTSTSAGATSSIAGSSKVSPATDPAEAEQQQDAPADRCKAASASALSSSTSEQPAVQNHAPAVCPAVPATTAPVLEYTSPLTRRFVSMKFRHPADAKPEDYLRLKQKLIAAVSQHASSAATIDDAGCAAPASPSSMPIVTDYIGFSGCWQVVMDITTSKSAVSAASDMQDSWQHATIAQAVLNDLPDWSFTGWQHLDAVPAQSAAKAPPGLYTMPAAVCASGSAAGPSSSSAQSHAHEALHAELLIPGDLAQQLLRAGHASLRVLVATQPEGDLLMDRTYTVFHRGGQSEGAETSEVTTATPAADVQLKLEFPAISSASAAAAVSTTTASCQVYSITVLAAEQTAAAAASAASAKVSATEPAEAAAAPREYVLAKLPLLLLPAQAQSEVQELFKTSIKEGCSSAAAYQLLLPLLQDWSMLLLPQANPLGADDTSSNSTAAQVQYQQLKATACEALLAFLDKAEKFHCYKLVSKQQQQIVQQSKRLQQHHHHQQQRQQQATADVTQVLGGCSVFPAAAAAAAAADAVDEACMNSKPNAAVESCDAGCSSRSGGDGTGSAAAVAAVPPVMTWKTIMIGFSDTTVCRAYNIYKALALKQHALLLFFVYTAAAVGNLVRAATIWWSVAAAPSAAEGAAVCANPECAEDSINVEALLSVYKAASVGCVSVVQLVMWAAACCAQRQQQQQQQRCKWDELFAPLVHRRDAAFIVLSVVYCGLIRTALLLGGIWRTAAVALVQAHQALPVSWLIPLLVPVVFRASPTSIMFCLILQGSWSISILPSWRDFWLYGEWAYPALLLQPCSAVLWEYSMQKAFVTHCRASARAERTC